MAGIVAVSYLNTIPFIYGIEHAGLLHAPLTLCPPSECALNFSEKKSDIALVPVAALSRFPEARIVTPYCIGATDCVRTVVLVSDSPAEGIERVFLDGDSLTSQQLVRILAREKWRIDPEWLPGSPERLASPQQGDAFLLIGDKVFQHENRFAHILDLAREWHELTALSFVFALWIADRNVPQPTIDALSASLEYGLNHIPEAIARYGWSDKDYAYRYLTQNIEYRFDPAKQHGLELFRRKIPG